MKSITFFFFSLLALIFFIGCTVAETRHPDSAPPRQAQVSLANLGLNINTELMIPKGLYARRFDDKITPRYITIHSTQNRAASAGARLHAVALNKGRLKSSHNRIGYMSWHYTVDAGSIYQHLPDNEQGQHADYEGPGNKTSIGIEMCENAGNSRAATLDHTARLVAFLCRKYRIPLNNVVPHYHWNRIRYDDGKVIGHKNCPHYLLDDGKPGAKWAAYKEQIRVYLNK